MNSKPSTAVPVTTIRGRTVPTKIAEAVAEALYDRGERTGWTDVSLVSTADGAALVLAALDAGLRDALYAERDRQVRERLLSDEAVEAVTRRIVRLGGVRNPKHSAKEAASFMLADLYAALDSITTSEEGG